MKRKKIHLVRLLLTLLTLSVFGDVAPESDFTYKDITVQALVEKPFTLDGKAGRITVNIPGCEITNYTGTHTDLEIPATLGGKKVLRLGTQSFWKNDSLKSVVIPWGVNEIGSYAFRLCPNLESVSIPESVRTIENFAFNGTKLSTVTLPNSVVSIGDRVFHNNPLLTEVIFEGDAVRYNKAITSTDNLTIHHDAFGSSTAAGFKVKYLQGKRGFDDNYDGQFDQATNYKVELLTRQVGNPDWLTTEITSYKQPDWFVNSNRVHGHGRQGALTKVEFDHIFDALNKLNAQRPGNESRTMDLSHIVNNRNTEPEYKENKAKLPEFWEVSKDFKALGVDVMTRHIKTGGEPALWKTAAGTVYDPYGTTLIHDDGVFFDFNVEDTAGNAWFPTIKTNIPSSLNGNLAQDIINDAHAEGQRIIVYHRHMEDHFAVKDHPEWVSRDSWDVEYLRKFSRGVSLCFNTAYREHVLTRLLELVDMGADGFYFDSVHQVEYCRCQTCRADGKSREDILQETFTYYKKKIHERNPDCVILVSARFDGVSHDLWRIPDVCKFEPKKIENWYGNPNNREIGYSQGLTFARDAADGKPGHLWAVSEVKDLLESAWVLAYGHIYNYDVHDNSLNKPDDPICVDAKRHTALGAKLSPYLNGYSPLRTAIVHYPEGVLDGVKTTPTVFPVFSKLMEQKIPLGMMLDSQLREGLIPEECQLLYFPEPSNSPLLEAETAQHIAAFKARGGVVIEDDVNAITSMRAATPVYADTNLSNIQLTAYHSAAKRKMSTVLLNTDTNTPATNLKVVFKNDPGEVYDVMGKQKLAVTTEANGFSVVVPEVDTINILSSSFSLTPALGVSVKQTGSFIEWRVEAELGVKEYRIVDEDGNVVETVSAQGLSLYKLTLATAAPVTLVVVDQDGSTQAFNPEDGNNISVTYNLSSGWNLIATVGDHSDFSKLKNVIAGAMWAWDGNQYVTSEGQDAFVGLWVYAPEDATIQVTAQKSPLTSLTLKAGWNLNGPANNVDAPEEVKVFSWDHRYNEVLKKYKALYKGIGYWFFAVTNKACEMDTR